MKRLIYPILVLFIGTQCSTDESLEHKAYTVNMKFVVNGIEEIHSVRFIYNNSQNRYVVSSDLIGEIKAINKSTKEEMYVYFIKSEHQKSLNTQGKIQYKMMTGYYGYSGSTGCYYYGTLYIGDNGESIFVVATGINAILNPPQCGYWYA